MLAVLAITACGASLPPDAVPVETTIARPAVAKTDGVYRIALSRPHHVGDRFRGSRKVESSSRTTTVEEAAIIDDVERHNGIFFEGDEEVLGVDGKREWTKLRVTVRTARVTGPRGESELFAAGTVLSFTRDQGDARGDVTSSAGELSYEQREAVVGAVSISDVTLTDDEGYGTSQPRAVGESWKVASTRLANDLLPGLHTSADLIDGETTLVALREDRGVPCMETAGRLLVRFTGSDGFKLPGSTVEGGEVVSEWSDVYPLDVKEMVHSGTSRTVTTMVTRLEGGQVRTTKSLELQEYAYERM